MIKIPKTQETVPDKRMIGRDKFNKYYGGFMSSDLEDLPIPLKPKHKRISK